MAEETEGQGQHYLSQHSAIDTGPERVSERNEQIDRFHKPQRCLSWSVTLKATIVQGRCFLRFLCCIFTDFRSGGGGGDNYFEIRV